MEIFRNLFCFILLHIKTLWGGGGQGMVHLPGSIMEHGIFVYNYYLSM